MTLEVRDIDEVGDGPWESFVAQAPEATFFHRAGWRRVVAAGCGHRSHYRAAIRDGRVVGVLPLAHVRTPLFGSALISTAFAVYGGIVADDTAAAVALAEDAVALGTRLGVGHIELRHRQPLAVLGSPGWTAQPGANVTFRHRLGGDVKANFDALPQAKRTDIRRARKEPLRVEPTRDLDAFYRPYAFGQHALGTPVYPRRLFEAIQREFPNETGIALAIGPDGPVSALLSFAHRDTIMPYFIGNLPAARPLHAPDFLLSWLMDQAVERGFRVFDFGRSKQGTSACAYKVRWGIAPEPLHYQFHLVRGRALPDHTPLNPRYRLLIAAWKRLPLPVANRLGPAIARQLG